MSRPVSISRTHLIDPWERRKKRSAAGRKASIERKTAELIAAYARLKLPIPMRLTPLPLPEPKVAFIPYAAKRERGSTGRRDAMRATTIRGSRIGRPPSAKTFVGKPCKRGHSSGLRYTAPPHMCVECQKARNSAKYLRKALAASQRGSPIRFQ
jgi:hypothetical protein